MRKLQFWLRYELPRRIDDFTMDVSFWLPRRLAYWCAIRVIAHATTGEWGTTDPNQISAMEAVGRWDDPRGGDRTLVAKGA